MRPVCKLRMCIKESCCRSSFHSFLSCLFSFWLHPASSYKLGREHTFRAKRWCIKRSMLCKAFPTSGTKTYLNDLFSTSTSWLYALGVGFMVFTITWDYSNLRTLEQTFGANRSWIWRTFFKQTSLGGVYSKGCFQSLLDNIVAWPFFFALPQNWLIRLCPSSPATKPMSLTTAVPCYKPQGPNPSGWTMIIHQAVFSWK